MSSINLYNVVDNKFTKDAKIDYKKLEDLVRLGVNVLDETLDYGLDMLPLEENKQCALDWRAIGLGVFGLADLFVAMGIQYGSKDAIRLTSDIFDHISLVSLDESCNLAKVKGTFVKYDWDKTKESPLIKSLAFGHDKLYKKIMKYGLRNGSLISVAPTGCQKKETIVGTSSGLLRLSELVDTDGDKWQSINNIEAEQDYGTNTITKGFINGIALTKKITMKSGLSLEATYNHKYRVIRDNKYIWVASEDIVEGDIIPSKSGYYTKSDYYELCKSTYPVHKQARPVTLPAMLDEKLGFIIGCYYANGSTHYDKSGNLKSIRFSMNTNKYEDILKITNSIKEVFDWEASIDTPNRGCTTINLASTTIVRWLDSNNLIKQHARHISIPKAIRCSPVSVIKAFLDGYYMCDGSHTGNSKYIDTSSYQMAQDIVVVKRAIGEDARIKVDTKRTGAKSKNPLYRVYLDGFLSKNYPEEKYRFVTVDKREKKQMVQDLLGEDFIFDEVVKIENSINNTYDIEVKDKHDYIANGVISHNTVSLFMGGYSGGVEPLFKISYERSTHKMEKENKKFRVFAKSVQDLLEHNKLPNTLSDDEIKQRFPFIIESHQVKPVDRIETQAIMQEYVDNAISSTINLPSDTSAKTIFDIYLKAWEQGLKGITVFVDGCLRGNILGVTDTKDEQEFKYDSIIPFSRRNTEEVSGKTYKLSSACAEKIYVTVNKTDNGDVFELFVNPTGSCKANVDTITRLVSSMLRSGISVDTIIDDLSIAKCPACQTLRNKGNKEISLSCGNAIATALSKAYNDNKDVKVVVNKSNVNTKEDDKDNEKDNEKDNHGGFLKCPECGEYTLKKEAHCATCQECGWSMCS